MPEEVKTKTFTVKKITEIIYKKKGAGPGWHVGVLTEDDEWINVNCFKEEDIHDKMKVNDKPLEVGKTYMVYLEGKYKNVKSFVPVEQKEKTYANKSDKEIAHMEGEGTGVVPKSSSKPEGPKTSYQFLTEEEHRFKDRKIVRQSCLKVAAEANPKGVPVEELKTYAGELEKWVFR